LQRDWVDLCIIELVKKTNMALVGNQKNLGRGRNESSCQRMRPTFSVLNIGQ